MTIRGKLIVVRHGQTAHNVQKLITGQMESDLTEQGRQQARDAGALIRSKKIRIDKVYSSPLRRAFNTAALVLEAGRQEHLRNTDQSWRIEIRGEITEKHAGKFQNRSIVNDAEFLAFDVTFDTVLPGGGESDRQVYDRVKALYDNEIMPRLMKGETVEVVAHSGVFRTLVVIAEGVDPSTVHDLWSFMSHVPNAEPLVYEYEDGVKTKGYYLGSGRSPQFAIQNNPPAQNKKKTRGHQP